MGGGVLWEYWLGIEGVAVSDLTGHSGFPDNPTGRRLLDRLASPAQFEDSYGARIRGFLHPRVSGEYRLLLESRGSSELWLSSDDRPENKTRLASIARPSSSHSRADGLSEPVELDAGKRYYFEILHKEGESKDFLEVEWMIPGGRSPRGIARRWLSPWSIEQVERIRFGKEEPFPDEPFELTVQTPARQASIRYTTDGSWPSPTHGELYKGPIAIDKTTVLRALAFKPGAVPTEIETRTYIFIDDVRSQQNRAPKNAHWSTAMDPGVVESPVYRDRIAGALQAIPSLSLVTSHEDMFGPDGIYRHPTEKGRAWERRASLELLRPGKREFQVNCGVRITGGRSREPRATPKHSFRVAFRRKYGPGKLRRRLFPDSPVDRYDSLVLRAGFNHSWTTRTAEKTYAQYLRNAFTRDAQNATGSFNGSGRFVHLYVNGVYWGLYFMEDRQDADFAAAVFGGDEDDYDVIQDRRAERGDLAAFDAMFDIANRGVSSDENFRKLLAYLDLTHFIDYLVVNNFLANYDWPIRNWRAIRKRVPGARFRFLTWDAEWTLPHYRPVWTNAGDYQKGLTIGNGGKSPGRLFQKLRENAEFRLRFGDRLHRHFYNEGAFYVDFEKPDWDPAHPERNRPAARYHQWAERIDQAIIAESARWGATRRRPAFTRDEEWAKERDRIVEGWLPRRAAQFLAQCREENLYPRLEAPRFSRHGGLVEPGFEVTLSVPAGTIYYTTDGSDPRRPFKGTVAAAAREYRGEPVRVELVTELKARVLREGSWSALNEAQFYMDQDWSALLMTEIMYHPEDDELLVDESLHEFVELKNTGRTPLDLGGLSFIAGIRFTFPMGTVLPGGGLIVLAANEKAFTRRYGFEPLGAYEGALNNGGERIRLTAPQGEVVLEVAYDDSERWPVGADGGGPSLVRYHADPAQDPNEPSSWKESREVGGSPGSDEPP